MQADGQNLGPLEAEVLLEVVPPVLEEALRRAQRANPEPLYRRGEPRRVREGLQEVRGRDLLQARADLRRAEAFREDNRDIASLASSMCPAITNQGVTLGPR